MRKLYPKLDYYVQLLLMLAFVIDLFFAQNYILTIAISIAVVQSISIVYHCLFAKTEFSVLRNFHYGGTCFILIFMFLLYFTSSNDIDIFGEALVVIFMVLSGGSIVLIICYLIETYNTYIDAQND
jgi:hypothetical protein